MTRATQEMIPSGAPLRARLWLPSVYLLALLLVAVPIIETVAGGWPPRPGEVSWRFGTLGIFASFLGTLFLGIFIGAVTAHLLGHRPVVRALGIVSVALATILAVALAGFILDYIQLRRMVRPELTGKFDVESLKASTTALTAIAAGYLLGSGGLRSSRPPEPGEKTHRRTKGEGLVVGYGETHRSDPHRKRSEGPR